MNSSCNLSLLAAAGVLLCSMVASTARAQAPEPEMPALTKGANHNPQSTPFVLNAQTRKMLNRSGTYLQDAGNGSRVLITNGGHQHVLMARMGSDGKVEMFCADSIHSAERWAEQAQARQVQQ